MREAVCIVLGFLVASVIVGPCSYQEGKEYVCARYFGSAHFHADVCMIDVPVEIDEGGSQDARPNQQ